MENTQNSQSEGGAGDANDANSVGQQGSLAGVSGIGSLGADGLETSGGANGAGSVAGDGALSSSAADLKKTSPKPPEASVKGRVLRDGEYGKINDVVTLTEAQAKRARKSGDVDTSDAAVKYAESLKVTP